MSVWAGILPEWSKGADLRSARRYSLRGFKPHRYQRARYLSVAEGVQIQRRIHHFRRSGGEGLLLLHFAVGNLFLAHMLGAAVAVIYAPGPRARRHVALNGTDMPGQLV